MMILYFIPFLFQIILCSIMTSGALVIIFGKKSNTTYVSQTRSKCKSDHYFNLKFLMEDSSSRLRSTIWFLPDLRVNSFLTVSKNKVVQIQVDPNDTFNYIFWRCFMR